MNQALNFLQNSTTLKLMELNLPLDFKQQPHNAHNSDQPKAGPIACAGYVLARLIYSAVNWR